MNEKEDIEDDFADTEGVGEVGECFSFVEEFKHSINSEDSIQSENDRTGDGFVAGGFKEEVSEVRGKQTQHVHLEKLVVDVVLLVR